MFTVKNWTQFNIFLIQKNFTEYFRTVIDEKIIIKVTEFSGGIVETSLTFLRQSFLSNAY